MAHTLITGASSGIGEATARLFAKQKRNLILLARRKDRLEKLRQELAGVDVRICEADVTDHEALEALFASFKGIEIDVVVNNAGLALGMDAFDGQDFSDVRRMIDVNVTGMMKVAHLSIPFLRKTNGHLVNLGSIAGLETYAGGTVYCATKHFVHAFTSGLRKDLIGSGVRVTTVAPGKVETEFSIVRLKGNAEAAKALYKNYRALKAEDIADAVRYAVECPPHVDVEQILVMPTDQAGMVTAKR